MILLWSVLLKMNFWITPIYLHKFLNSIILHLYFILRFNLGLILSLVRNIEQALLRYLNFKPHLLRNINMWNQDDDLILRTGCNIIDIGYSRKATLTPKKLWWKFQCQDILRFHSSTSVKFSIYQPSKKFTAIIYLSDWPQC